MVGEGKKRRGAAAEGPGVEMGEGVGVGVGDGVVAQEEVGIDGRKNGSLRKRGTGSRSEIG